MTERRIIHIDMDYFFAQVEMRDNPKLKGKPVIVGGKASSRGVVSTASYEARKYGVHSAMPMSQAHKLCPNGYFVTSNFGAYRETSAQIMSIFRSYTDKVEPMSLDEAYLDITELVRPDLPASKIAQYIRKDILEQTHLTASAGVSYNKFLAKLASDFEKPKGLTLILPEDAQDFLEKLPIEKFYGVGKRSVEKLHQLGVFTGADLLEIPEMTLIDLFGRFGYDLYRKARGISNSPVKSNRIRKSIGSERTYGKLLYEEDDVKSEISKNAQRVVDTLQRNHKVGRTIVLKVRYSDFSTLTKRITLDDVTNDFEVIDQVAKTIYDSLDESKLGVRLLGVTVTGLEDNIQPLNLFDN